MSMFMDDLVRLFHYFYSDFIILPGYIDFAPGDVVSIAVNAMNIKLKLSQYHVSPLNK